MDVYLGKINEMAVAVSEENDARRGAMVKAKDGNPSREIIIQPADSTADLNRWEENVGWIRTEIKPRLVVSDTVVELAIPFDVLDAGLGATMGVSLALFKDGLVVQRLPEEGEVVVQLAVQNP